MRSAGKFSNSDAAAAAAAVAKSMRSAGEFSVSNAAAAAVIREESAFQVSNKVLLLLLLLLLLQWICSQQVHSGKRSAVCTTPACACKHNRLRGSFTHQASVCRRQQRDGFAERKGEVWHTAMPILPKGSLQVPKGSLQVPKGSLRLSEGRLGLSEGRLMGRRLGLLIEEEGWG